MENERDIIELIWRVEVKLEGLAYLFDSFSEKPVETASAFMGIGMMIQDLGKQLGEARVRIESTR